MGGAAGDDAAGVRGTGRFEWATTTATTATAVNNYHLAIVGAPRASPTQTSQGDADIFTWPL